MTRRKSKAKATSYLRGILRGLPLDLYRGFRGREILAILESVEGNIRDVGASSQPLPRRITAAFAAQPPRQPKKADILACVLHRGPSFLKGTLLGQLRSHDWGHLLIWFPNQVPPPAASESLEEWVRWADICYIPDLWPPARVDDLTPTQRKFRSLVLGVAVISTTRDAIEWKINVDLDQDPHDIKDEMTRRVGEESRFTPIRPTPHPSESNGKRAPPGVAYAEPRTPRQPVSPSPQRSARLRRNQYKRVRIATESPRNRLMAQRTSILRPASGVWEPRQIVGSHSRRHGLGRAEIDGITAAVPAQVDKEIELQPADSDGVKDEVGRAAIAKVAQKLLSLEQEMSQKLDAITQKLSAFEERIDRITNVENEIARPRKRLRKDSVKDTFAETILELQ